MIATSRGAGRARPDKPASRAGALRASLVAMLALALIASACSGDDGGPTDAGSDEPIKIGASLPLTGDFAQPGTAAQRGYQIWEEMVNADGGILGRDVELLILDDASDQNTVVAD